MLNHLEEVILLLLTGRYKFIPFVAISLIGHAFLVFTLKNKSTSYPQLIYKKTYPNYSIHIKLSKDQLPGNKISKSNKKTKVDSKKNLSSTNQTTFIKEASLNGNVSPKYPTSARLEGREGKVLVEVYISKEGKVKSSKILNPDANNLDLAQAVLESLEKATFGPAQSLNGPIDSKKILTFVFNLN